jgi:uncharacterized membrane protein
MTKSFYVAAGAVLLQGMVAGCSSGQMEPAAQPMAAAPASSFDQTVSPFFTTYCTGCHSGADARAGVQLTFANEAETQERASADADFWGRVAGALEEGRMPPAFAPSHPTDEERATIVEWINATY